jgi:hypothetical protein
MKWKRIIITILICVITASILSGPLVYAPSANSGPKVDKVYVINTDPMPVDVSGWLHTTKSGREVISIVEGGIAHTLFETETKGYKQLTIRLLVTGPDCNFQIFWWVWDEDVGVWDRMNSSEVTVAHASMFVQTYDVIGDRFTIYVNTQATVSSAGCYYYLTT